MAKENRAGKRPRSIAGTAATTTGSGSPRSSPAFEAAGAAGAVAAVCVATTLVWSTLGLGSVAASYCGGGGCGVARHAGRFSFTLTDPEVEYNKMAIKVAGKGDLRGAAKYFKAAALV